jgi:hypothetical protein
LALALLVALPSLQACVSCFGKTDAPLAKGMNAGIFALLAFVGLFWAAFASFFVFIVRRNKTHGQPLPGDQNDSQHN